MDADCLVLGKHQHILVSKSITQKARKKKEEEKEKRHKHAKIKEKQEQKARMNTCMHIYPAYIKEAYSLLTLRYNMHTGTWALRATFHQTAYSCAGQRFTTLYNVQFQTKITHSVYIHTIYLHTYLSD